MFRLLLTAFFLLTLLTVTTTAQKPTIEMYLQQVAKGWTTDAKKALPDLLIDRPDDPGVMFLHASLVEDPKRALPLLERIVQNYPTSEWADDALTRMILYACVTKDVEKANASFRKMRDQYGSSTLLPVAYDAMRMSVGVPAPATAAELSSTVVPATTKAAPAAPAAPAATERPYTLNTKTLASKDDAQKVLDSFKAKRMRAVMTEKWVSGKRNWVIQVGEYETEVDAAKDVDVVRAICKCKPVVVKR